MQPAINLHILGENELIGTAWDQAIRDLLCVCFPADAKEFARSRAWHDSAPSYTTFYANGDQVMAHIAVVSRRITCGMEPFLVAGLQSVCVHPSRRKQGLLDKLLTKCLEEARVRQHDFGLLFCVPEIEKVYARSGWRCIPDVTVIMYDEQGTECPLPGKNITMFYPLRQTELPAGTLNLQGRDW